MTYFFVFNSFITEELPYRNQFIDLESKSSKSMNWFLYDRTSVMNEIIY